MNKIIISKNKGKKILGNQWSIRKFINRGRFKLKGEEALDPFCNGSGCTKFQTGTCLCPKKIL